MIRRNLGTNMAGEPCTALIAWSRREDVDRMKRQEFITLLGGTAGALPLALRAEQKAMPAVGILTTSGPPASLVDLVRGPIHQGLSDTGYIEGQNVAFEYRFAAGHYDRLPALASDLVSRKVDVIVAVNGTPTALAAKGATSTIPIVFINVGDPVGIGLVASLARPGGNITGFTNITTELMPKLVELLTELVPQAKVIALLVNPNNANAEGVIRNTQEAAQAKGVQLSILKAGTQSEIDAAFAALVQLQAGGLVIDPDGFFTGQRAQIVALASRHAVPAIYPHPQYVSAGGLIAYGIDDDAVYRQAGIYAGRILKGAKPADLPVQQPATFQLAVNLKTAKALGLTVPQLLLATANEVIE
jgi:putative ABC transport system substrate-binding protein